MQATVRCSAQTFDRLTKFMKQNTNASQYETMEEIRRITDNPIEGYVVNFDEKLKSVKVRFVHDVVKNLIEEEKAHLLTRGDVSKTLKKLFSKEVEKLKIYRTTVKKYFDDNILVKEENQEKFLKKVKNNIKKYSANPELSGLSAALLDRFLEKNAVNRAAQTNAADVSDAEVVPLKPKKSKPVQETPEQPQQPGTES